MRRADNGVLPFLILMVDKLAKLWNDRGAIRKAAITSSGLSSSIDTKAPCPASLFMSFPSYQMGKRKAIGLLAVTTNTPFTMTANAILFDTRLPALVRVCYSALEDFSGEHLTCWPGYEAIAKKVGCSARWIPVLLKRLVEAGLLLVQYRQGKTNIYTLLGRVARQKATQEDKPGLPMKPNNYEQKQPTKTKEDRAYRRLNGIKKGPVDFSKYQKGGVYEAAVIS